MQQGTGKEGLGYQQRRGSWVVNIRPVRGSGVEGQRGINLLLLLLPIIRSIIIISSVQSAKPLNEFTWVFFNCAIREIFLRLLGISTGKGGAFSSPFRPVRTASAT